MNNMTSMIRIHVWGGWNWYRTCLWAKEALENAGFKVDFKWGREKSGIENTRLLVKGETDITTTLPYGARLAYHAKGPYRGEKIPVASLAFVMHPFHWFVSAVTEECGLRSFRDIAEKKPPIRLAVPPEGYLTGFVYKQIFNYYGVSLYTDVATWGGKLSTSHEKASSMIITGELDGIMREITPKGTLSVVGNIKKLRFLPMEEGLIHYLEESCLVERDDIFVDAYPGVESPIPTVLSGDYPLIIRADLREELVYEIAKALDQNSRTPYITGDIFYSPKYAGLDYGVPLHPGAKRYYEEMGYYIGKKLPT